MACKLTHGPSPPHVPCLPHKLTVTACRYVILDNTLATMGDLIGFEGYLNESAPYVPAHEHEALWKTPRRYHDFGFGTEFNTSCLDFPRLYMDNGSEVAQTVYDSFGGCYDGDFDQVSQAALSCLVQDLNVGLC